MAIIIIDFNNTITDRDSYPEIGNERRHAKRVINGLYDAGHCIIINTCRCGDAQERAQKWLFDHGIKFCHINENCELRKTKYSNDTRKLGGHIAIDDKNLECMYRNKRKGVNWLDIEIMLFRVLSENSFEPDTCYKEFSET
jgi:hypothetical protein